MDTREFFIEFTLRNACVTIFNDRYTQFRPWFTSLDDDASTVGGTALRDLTRVQIMRSRARVK